MIQDGSMYRRFYQSCVDIYDIFIEDIVGLYIRPYDDLLNTQESFVYSSLYVFKQQNGFFVQNRSQNLVTLLLLLSGDIELCPGPTLRCSTCNKTIRKNQETTKVLCL